MEKVEGAGVELAYDVFGAGAPVLVVHGIASDAQAWTPFARELAEAARVVVYDRRGYGESGMPDPYEGTTVEEQAQDAAALARGVGAAPAVIVGDGLGALVALDLAKRHRPLVRAAVLSDPPLFAFVAEATEKLAAERVVLEETLRASGPEEAVAAWLDATSGPATWEKAGNSPGFSQVGEEAAGAGEEAAAAGAPAGARERARRAHRAFFADYAGLTSWPVTRAELRALDVDAVVLTGPLSRPHVVAAADALADLMPAARRERDGDVAAATRSLLA